MNNLPHLRPVTHLYECEDHPLTLQALLDTAERNILVQTLAECHGSRKRVAARLGISRSTLFNKMRKHDLLDIQRRPTSSRTAPANRPGAAPLPRAASF